jgi:hypothetical protein
LAARKQILLCFRRTTCGFGNPKSICLQQLLNVNCFDEIFGKVFPFRIIQAIKKIITNLIAKVHLMA